MKININDNAIFTAAMHLAEDYEYFDALTMFARVDSYESMLNQIGCLCELNDIGYALERFRDLIARYGLTHNCYDDLLSLGKSVEVLASCVGKTLKDFGSRKDNRISADPSLLCSYQWDTDDSDDESDEDYFDEDDYAALTDTPSNQSRFFDINSVEYINSVRQNMESAFLSGDFAKGLKLQKQFLNFDTNDAPSLAMQMVCCFAQQKWAEAAKYAQKLADYPDASMYSLGIAAEVLFRSDGDARCIEKVLSRLIAYGEDINDEDMMNYITIAANTLGYGEITLQLCKILYSHFLDAGCVALRLCAEVFFNCGELNLARQAVLELLKAAPWDSVGKLLLEYFNSGLSLPLENPVGFNNVVRCYDVPEQLTSLAHFRLKNALSGATVNKTEFVYVDCLIKGCIGAILKNNSDVFSKQLGVLEKIVATLSPADGDAYVEFLKKQFCTFLPETSLNKIFLYRLLKLGYKGKTLVNLLSGFYCLDLSKTTCFDDRFLQAFGICATLRRVDCRKMEKSFDELVRTLNLPDDGTVDARQLAYAMLAVTYKTFPQSAESGYFAEEDFDLYARYLKIFSDNRNDA